MEALAQEFALPPGVLAVSAPDAWKLEQMLQQCADAEDSAAGAAKNAYVRYRIGNLYYKIDTGTQHSNSYCHYVLSSLTARNYLVPDEGKPVELVEAHL